MNADTKKKKGKNISEGDKANFLDLMKTHAKILECKKHDNNAINKKRMAWENIEADYNAEASVQKSQAQLKVLWKDLKAKAKKSVSKQKRDMVKTGGGKKEPDLDKNTQIVADLIPQVFESLSNVRDDDDEDEPYIDDSEDSSEKADESNKNIGFVAEEVSPQDAEAASSSTSAVNNHAGPSWMKRKPKKKVTLHSTISGNVVDFHALKVKLLKEEHQTKMMLFERQRAMAEEEHELRMNLLRKMYDNQSDCNQIVEKTIVQSSEAQVFTINSLNDLEQLVTVPNDVFELTSM